jgi:hypothetical protein
MHYLKKSLFKILYFYPSFHVLCLPCDKQLITYAEVLKNF